MSIGEKIKKRRMEMHMTQKELASRVGTTKAAISHYEVGSRIPRPNQLTALMTVLGLSPNEFASREDRVIQAIGEPVITIDYTPGFDAVFDEEPPEEEQALEQLNCILRVVEQCSRLAEQGESPLSALQYIEDMISDFLRQFSTLIANLDRAQNDAIRAKAKYDAARKRIRHEGRTQTATAENPLLNEWEKLNRKGKSEAIKRIKELCRLPEYMLAEAAVSAEATELPQPDWTDYKDALGKHGMPFGSDDI